MADQGSGEGFVGGPEHAVRRDNEVEPLGCSPRLGIVPVLQFRAYRVAQPVCGDALNGGGERADKLRDERMRMLLDHLEASFKPEILDPNGDGTE